MTKLAYLECPTGIAGDMCLGALVHAGVPVDYLVESLERLGLQDEYQLWAELVHRNGQQATQVHVELQTSSSLDPHSSPHAPDPSCSSHESSPGYEANHQDDHLPLHLMQAPSPQRTHSHGGRHLPEIEQCIKAAQLPPRAEAWSLAVFRRLAQAEGAVHGISPDKVHFHEVGATDAIVDIVGTCLGLDWLEIDELYCSPLPVGGGTVRAAHGLLPVPAPAVLQLLEMGQVPIYSNGINRELVTPTGAAIVTTLATRFGPPPPMTLQRVGLGAGSRNLPIPNILRLWLGHSEEADQMPKAQLISQGSMPVPAGEPLPHVHPHDPVLHKDATSETIAVLQTQIDDLNPQAIGYVFERLFDAGALDVYTQAIGMKKSRPGILLSVICLPERRSACEAVLFQETTTLGIRYMLQQRTILQREIQSVATRYGAVRVKIAQQPGASTVINVQPEYEDCAQLARMHSVPWLEVHRMALQGWYQQHPSR